MIEETMPFQPDSGEPAPADPAQEALVKEWAGRIQKAKAFHKKAFDRMREDMQFCRGKQWSGQQADEDGRLVVNITQRYVAQKTAALYAKNPTFVAYRRKRLDFQLWDEDPQSILQAQQMMAQLPAMATDPMAAGQAQALMVQTQQMLADFQQGVEHRKQMEKLARTLELVMEYQIGEQLPPFKKAMKQLVRRTITTGVGYLKLGFHRLYDRKPEDVARVTDVTEQMVRIERLGESATEQDKAEYAELKAMLDAAQSVPDVVVREGLDIDYPPSTSLIVDPRCRQLQGFIGARWVAQEFMLSHEAVEEIYGVDVKTATEYDHDGEAVTRVLDDDESDGKKSGCVAVYEIYDKASGLCMTLCEGHKTWLRAPAVPPVRLERFWPFFVLTFNDVEDETCIFPPSDVRLLRPMQQEYNITRQRLREHRDANRPKHVAPKGQLDEQDKSVLTGSSAHTLVELNGLQPGQTIQQLLQPVPHNPIDPNLYEVNSIFEDVLRVGGNSEANLGMASGATATESSIAESSRLSAIGSNVDDLDDFLTDMARSAGQVLLHELSAETVAEVAGPGAVWPTLSMGEIARELMLSIRAGSSGRPNKAAEISNFERLAPYFLQVPGLNPKWLLERIVERLDDRFDVTDAFVAGLPSITAMNAQKQLATGDPATDPNQQGAAGADKTAVQQGDTNMQPSAPQAAPVAGQNMTVQ